MTEGGAPFRVDVVEMPNGALVKADGDIDLDGAYTDRESEGGPWPARS
jgi:hypothetical protein